MTATSLPANPPAPPASAPDPAAPRLELVQSLLNAALQAQRSGTLEELVRDRARVARWLVRRHERIIRGTAGDALPAGTSAPVAALLLRWLVTQLRPDAEPGFAAIGDEAWLQLPGWRPMLSMASHAGFLRIPDFPRQYHRRSGEVALDNLCGLWSVGPSTVYRLLERARHAMAQLLMDPAPDALRRLSLRRLVTEDVHARLGLADAAGAWAWHRHQALAAQGGPDAASELWHRQQARDVAGFVQTLRRRAGELASEPETDALVELEAAQPMPPRLQVDLWLARAALARTRNAPEMELRAYEQARSVAQRGNDALLLGIVHSALGKYHEQRDGDRAFACYQDSAEFLRDLGPETGDVDALEHFVTTFARLAWLYLIRNDSRCKALLDRAQALRTQFRVPDEVLGMLEQVWGEYWHRSGDPARSLEHRFRALNIFERVGDQRSVLAACANIGLDLATRGDHDRAIGYLLRVLAAARHAEMEPKLVVSARLNLGATYFWKGELDSAIEENRLALELSLACQLKLDAFRARYNLAEAHYTRFRLAADPGDESAGDRYASAALESPGPEISPAAVESIRHLKASILAQAPAVEPDRMLPAEAAAHFEENTEVQRLRQALSVPADPQSQARARLAIARAYYAIAGKEREAALALIDRHGLQRQFVAELDELRRTFERELTREQQLAAAWKRSADDIVDDTHRAALIAHLLREGALSKASYGELRGVAPATASKHLGMLAERGLLVQRGKGPSTRYELAG